MAVFLIIFAVEAILCKIMFNPTAETDMEMFSLGLMILNALIVFVLLTNVVDRKDKDHRYMTKLFMASFGLRLFLLLWDIYARHIFVLPNSEADAVWYHTASVSYAFLGRSNLVDLNEYSYYVGLLYRLIGSQKLTIEFLHVFLSMWALVLIYKILCMLNVREKIRRQTITIVALLPNLMIIGTVFLQESVISFLLILSLYFYTKWWTKQGALYFLLSFLPPIAASFLHTGGIVTAVGFAVTYMLVGNRERKLKITPGKMILGVALIGVMLVLMSSFSSTLFGKIGGELSADAIVNNAGQTDRVSDAEYSVGIKGLPPAVDIVVNSPIRMLYFVSSPLPWMWRGLGDIIAFFGSALFYIWCVYLCFKAFKDAKGKKKPEQLWAFFIVLLITLIIASLMFGWGVSNTGSALRHREKFTYLFAVLFGVTQECIAHFGGKTDEEDGDGHRTDLRGRKLPNGLYYKY